MSVNIFSIRSRANSFANNCDFLFTLQIEFIEFVHSEILKCVFDVTYGWIINIISERHAHKLTKQPICFRHIKFESQSRNSVINRTAVNLSQVIAPWYNYPRYGQMLPA